MLRFLSFGSGSSGNCYLLESTEGSILIDAGVGYRKVRKYFVEYGVNQEKIKAIFLTHDHTDHIAAVSSLAIYLKTPVYATATVHQRVKTNFRIHLKLPKHLIMPIEKRQPIDVAGFRVEAFDVPHDSADCSGYTITAEGLRFVLVTDCGEVTPLVAEMATAAQYLVLEANYDREMLENGPYPAHLRKRIDSATGHLSNEQSATFLSMARFDNLKKVFFCHLSENNNRPELVEEKMSGVLGPKGIPFKVLDRKSVNGFFELV